MLISVELGMEKDVLNKVKLLPGIKEAYVTYGVYDLIVVIEAQTVDRLNQIIANKIRILPALKSTLTMIADEKG